MVEWRGCPRYIRCDNGPEFIAENLKRWAEKNSVKIKHIQAGKPTQNGIIERLNKTLRVECLNLQWCDSLAEVNQYLDDWLQTYNVVRPHSSIGFIPPDELEQSNKHLYFDPVSS